MIGRRAFTLGLGAGLLSARAGAEIRYNGADLDRRESRPIKKLPYVPFEKVPNHRQMMRDIIIELARFCHGHAPALSVVTRNAPELAMKGRREWLWETWRDPESYAKGEISPLGSINQDYFRAIDGLLIDGMFSGREAYGVATRQAESAFLLSAAQAARSEKRPVFSIEYGPPAPLGEQIARTTIEEGFVSWIDVEGDKSLSTIPAALPPQENADHILSLSDARNFLALLDSSGFVSKAAMVKALAETNYDLLIVGPFWNDVEPLGFEDMKGLKFKKTGARRLALCHMPIGRAYEGAFYWKKEWREGDPSWLFAPDPDHPRWWVVEYWSDGWKKIMGDYVVAAARLGFDGVFLDSADTYLLFEDMMPIE